MNSFQEKKSNGQYLINELFNIPGPHGMKVNNTLRHQLTPIRKAIVMKSDNKNGGDVGNVQPLFTLVGVQINIAIMEISLEEPQNIKNGTTI